MENQSIEAQISQHSHMSVISLDKERSYKGVYLLVCATPFLIIGAVSLSSLLSVSGSPLSLEDLKMAVLFFSCASVLIAMGIRIMRYQYHLLIDKNQGHFSYQKDSLLSTSRIQGEVKQIKEISIRSGATVSFRSRKEGFSRALYRIIARYNHQDLIVYLSTDEEEALSMATTLSNFLGVPMSREDE
jgi:hypothetical protein